MKRLLILISMALCFLPDAHSRVLVNVNYEGEPLNGKNILKIEQMLGYMSDFYTSLNVHDTLDVTLIIFKTQEEGYEYMRKLYPKSSRYRKTASNSYFGSGVGGVYMPDRKTAVVLGIEKGVDRGLNVVYHELSHHFTHILFNKINPPIWFNEGLAEYFEHARYTKKKGWYVDFPDFAKGKLRTMHMLGEIDLKSLLDIDRKNFMGKQYNEGQNYYSFAFAAVTILYEKLPQDKFGAMVSRLVDRNTESSIAEIVNEVYEGGISAFERDFTSFIQ